MVLKIKQFWDEKASDVGYDKLRHHKPHATQRRLKEEAEAYSSVISHVEEEGLAVGGGGWSDQAVAHHNKQQREKAAGSVVDVSGTQTKPTVWTKFAQFMLATEQHLPVHQEDAEEGFVAEGGQPLQPDATACDVCKKAVDETSGMVNFPSTGPACLPCET